MSDRLPYEDILAGKWDDLPLPDENIAWDDMKRRLDDDDDKPIIPFWLRGCAGWALLGILAVGLAWWLLKPLQWFTHEKPAATEKTKSDLPEASTKDNKQETREANDTSSMNYPSATLSKPGTNTVIKTDSTGIKQAAAANPGTTNPTGEKIPAGNSDRTLAVPVKSGIQIKAATRNSTFNTKPEVLLEKNQAKKQKSKIEKLTDGAKRTGTIPQADTAIQSQTGPANPVTSTVKPQQTDTVTTAGNIIDTGTPKDVQGNRTAGNDTTAVVKKPAAQDTNTKQNKDSTRKNQLEWSAGIGIQQQIPVAGQKWTPYNAQGRKGTLADYIPSVYVRLTRPGKWFLQGEFRYGAPKLTKSQLYKQTRQNDTGSAPLFYIQNSYIVKKTYYHELPFVFNYYIRPGWSVGAGIQWNRFYRAIEEKEIIRHDNILDSNTLLSKSVQPVKRDSASAFKSSFFQAVLETQYQWRRFSLGARYTFGLQPYIEFALPGSEVQRAKMQSLQLFIRFQLWRSRSEKKRN